MVEIPGLPDPSEPPKRVKLPGIDGAEDEKKKEEKKRAGVAFSLAGLGGILMLGGPRAFIAGMLTLGLGGAGVVTYTVWKGDRGTGSERVEGGAGFQSRAHGGRRLGSGGSRAAGEQRASSIGFVAGVKGGMKYRADGGGPGSGEPGPGGSASSGSPGAAAQGSYDAGGAGAPGGPGAGGAAPRKRLKSMGGFRQNPFSASGGMQRKGLSGLDNPNMGGLRSFKRDTGGDMSRHLQAAHSKLASKNLGNKITASKTMGQLKFAGKRSRQAADRKSLDAKAGYSEQAFSQNERVARSIADRQGDTRPGTGPAGPAGMIGDSGSSYSTELGRQVSYGAHNTGPGGCPEGMMPVQGGGCEPAGVGGENSTRYQNLVRQAWDLVRKAHRSARRLDLWSAKHYSTQAENLGTLIKDVYGQEMQGEIIHYWADRSNEFTHWNQGEERAHELRQTEMDPKLDGDVHEAAQEERNTRFR